MTICGNKERMWKDKVKVRARKKEKKREKECSKKEKVAKHNMTRFLEDA